MRTCRGGLVNLKNAIMKISFEYPSFNKQSSFDVFLKSQDSEDLPMHCHPNYELNLVIRENGIRYVGENSEKFEEGDLVLLTPGVPHRWVNDDDIKHPYSSLVFICRKNFSEMFVSLLRNLKVFACFYSCHVRN